MLYAIIPSIFAALFLGYIIGSECERYRNKNSALGYLAERIEKKLKDK